MKIVKQHLPLLLVATFLPGLSGCSDSDPAPGDVTENISLQFAAKVNGADYNCGQIYTGVGSGGHDFKVNGFRMYVHETHLHDDATGNTYPVELNQDGVWQLDDLAMLDFEDDCGVGTPETNTTLQGTVTLPAAVDLSATEVCFTVGVPADKNHIDETTAASPLNASGMLWAWKVGRKYIRIDGFGDPANTNNPFNLHLGAQGCPGASTTAPPTSACSVPNTFEVCVDAFNVSTDRIAVDVGTVLEGNDVSVNLNGGPTARPGCMSFIDDNDCEEIMPRLGLDYAYGRVSGTRSTYSGGQRMFSKE